MVAEWRSKVLQNAPQYFWPALSDKWAWKPIFGLFESGCIRQVLLYKTFAKCYCTVLRIRSAQLHRDTDGNVPWALDKPHSPQQQKYLFYLISPHALTLLDQALRLQCIKLFPCSIQLSTKFIMLINVKMQTIVGILTLIRITNKTSERLKAINFFICLYFSFYELLKFRAQLSWFQISILHS